MNYPGFFDTIEPITLQDPLSDFLGTFDEGIVTFSYLDIVKSAGHSCPTVAGAYLSTQAALKALYSDELPQRGNIKVAFGTAQTEGVTGVIATVISNITGATTDYGFKGINGNFNRTNLMFFDQEVKESSIQFTRLNTQTSVTITYDPSPIPAQKEQPLLMQKIMQGIATPEEKVTFSELWQGRVRRIFEASERVILIS